MHWEKNITNDGIISYQVCHTYEQDTYTHIQYIQICITFLAECIYITECVNLWTMFTDYIMTGLFAWISLTALSWTYVIVQEASRGW